MRKSRAILAIAGVALLSAAALALAMSGHDRPALLGGNGRIAGNADASAAGAAEAYAFEAQASGPAQWVAVYVDSDNRAKAIHVALYTDAHGRPATLLTSGATAHPAAGGWNDIGVKRAQLERRSRYWLAVLGTGGAVAYRDRTGHPCSSEASAQAGLTAFPQTWRSGRRWPTCTLSAVVGETRSLTLEAPSKRTARPASHFTAGNPRSPRTPSNEPSGTATKTGCVARPSRCGYPDASNTGVPPGTSLTPSGSLSVNTDGAVVSGRSVTGTINVYASGVTIKDTRVTASVTGEPGIVIHSPATGVTIMDSTIGGPDAGGTSAGIAIHNTTSAAMTVERVNIHNAADGVDGLQRTTDSYVLTDGSVPGAHVEPVYIPGGGRSSAMSTVQHNTLLNPQEQTAAIFADCHSYGPCWNMMFEDNLLEGGDYTIECCDGAGTDGPSGNTSITNNRFARTYHRRGGQYGWESGVDPSRTTWSGNIWDDSGSRALASQ